MKIRPPYKFTSGLLSISVMLSFFVSVCSMDMMEMCDQMMMEHSSMEMVEIAHSVSHKDMMHKTSDMSTDCESALDCDCSIDRGAVATIAPTVHLKIGITPTLISLFETYTVDQDIFSTDLNLSIQKYYSPPPLFLANESFLI